MRSVLATVALTATPSLALTLPNQHATPTMMSAQGGGSRRGWLSSGSALVVGTFTASAPAHALGFGEEAPVPMDLGVFGLKVIKQYFLVICVSGCKLVSTFSGTMILCH